MIRLTHKYIIAFFKLYNLLIFLVQIREMMLIYLTLYA